MQRERSIRSFALSNDILVITSIAGAQAAVNAIESIKKHKLEVRSLQDYHPHYAKTAAKTAAV